MVRLRKSILGVALLAGSLGSAPAFSLLGPYLAWQTTDLGYQLPDDIGGPMVLSAGYRWTTPVVTYAFDESFVRYFGQQGMNAVDQAFKILNDLPPMTAIKSDGSRILVRGRPVPMDALGPPNGQALAGGLYDVKSFALSLIIEEMGLAEPTRYTWTLRARATGTLNNTPVTNYTVRVLNFDPATLRPTNRVNSVYYGYIVQDPIQTPNLTYADAVERVSLNPDDLLAFTAVADGAPPAGYYFIGLSADDVGGLRYLYNRNTMFNETLPPGILPGTPAVVDSAWVPWSYRTNVVQGLIPSPWLPYFNLTNGLLQGTNLIQGTNLVFSTVGLLAGTNANLIVTNGLRPGVNKIRFKKVVYDSLIGQTFTPITNRYTDQVITNRTLVLQPVDRVITQPDILFLAEDLGLAINNYTPILNRRTDTSGWLNNDAINGAAVAGGPGQILGAGATNVSVRISFSDQLPYVINRFPAFMDESLTAGWGGYWGSFDGTTNDPIVYPAFGGLTIKDIINQVVVSGSGNN